MSAQVAGLDDIIADFELRQFEYLFIAPPGEAPWVQGGGILPFDPEDFPKDFVAGLVPETRNGITNYTVYVFEDPETHERVFANANQTEIAAVDPPEDYDPNWFVDYRYPTRTTTTRIRRPCRSSSRRTGTDGCGCHEGLLPRTA